MSYTTHTGAEVQVVDISQWTEAERSDIHAEYAVVGAPYGESIPTQWHDSLGNAERALWETQGLVRGTTYDTSWGTQDADYASVRIVQYVALVTDSETGSVVLGDWEAPLLVSEEEYAASQAHMASEDAAPVDAAPVDAAPVDALTRAMDEGYEEWRDSEDAPFVSSLYSPEGEPLSPHYGAPFGMPTSHPTRALTASMELMSPVSARNVSHDDFGTHLHNSIQEGAQLFPQRQADGFWRPYLSSDAPYRRLSAQEA